MVKRLRKWVKDLRFDDWCMTEQCLKANKQEGLKFF